MKAKGDDEFTKRMPDTGGDHGVPLGRLPEVGKSGLIVTSEKRLTARLRHAAGLQSGTG